MARTSTIIISHRSAARFYLTADPRNSAFPRPCTESPLQRANLSGEMPSALPPHILVGKPEFLVGSPNQRRNAKSRVVHCCELDMPRGSFWKFGEHAYIASPELCFIQMASILSAPQLAELGTNLCAKYYRDLARDSLREREPVTCADNIRRYASRLPGRSGKRRAQQALRWVSDNAASPMETKLYLLLAYPVCRGGYGFEGLTFNYRVDPRRSKKLVDQEFFSIDICRPDKMAGIEYYGKDVHEDVIKDRRRLDGLEALGWSIVVIDRQRLYDIDAFHTAALQIAKHLGKRVRRNEADWRKAALQLRQELRLA